MRIRILLAAAVLGMAPGVASAQELVSNPAAPCQKFANTSETAPLGRDALYLHAACVAARAGVAAPANGPLSREELLSILMLMSLQQSPPSHAS